MLELQSAIVNQSYQPNQFSISDRDLLLIEEILCLMTSAIIGVKIMEYWPQKNFEMFFKEFPDERLTDHRWALKNNIFEYLYIEIFFKKWTGKNIKKKRLFHFSMMNYFFFMLWFFFIKGLFMSNDVSSIFKSFFTLWINGRS